jgi:hypothetical protein
MLPTAVPEVSTPASREIADWNWSPIDSLLLAALAIASILLIRMQIRWDITPIEDASMLLRYSQNFAHGYGLRWNVHQPPVDGATDFLYTVAIGAFSRVSHLGVITSSRILNLSAHLASVLLLFAAGRRLLGANRWICVAFATYLAAGPAVDMANGCFGAPCFAFLLLACWCAGLYYARFKTTWLSAIGFSLLGLLAGLTRPEGVLIALLLLLATLYLTLTRDRNLPNSPLPGKLAFPIIISFTLIFATLGGAYFAWHWKYFSYPLPNPFYIKGDGRLYPASLRFAAMNLARMLAPAFPLLPLGLLSRSTHRLTFAITGFMLCFTSMWILLTNANNHFGRFQYAVVPLFLLTITALASQAGLLFRESAIASLPSSKRWLIPATGVLALCSATLYVNHLYGTDDSAFGMRTFADRLQPLAAKGYTIVVTEAGALPFYSQWQAIDALGLNDAYVAHAPEHHISAEYLDQFHPEIIMIHLDVFTSPIFAQTNVGDPPTSDFGGWNQQFLSYYAKSHGYTLAAAYGLGQCNLHLYWVRPGFADYDVVLSDIRDHPYYFLDGGNLTQDHRNELDSIHACHFRPDPS